MEFTASNNATFRAAGLSNKDARPAKAWVVYESGTFRANLGLPAMPSPETTSSTDSPVHLPSEHNQTGEVYSPPFSRRGGCAHQRFPELCAQTGWLVKSRSFLIDFREAHRINKERFAEIYKEASRRHQPPRPR